MGFITTIIIFVGALFSYRQLHNISVELAVGCMVVALVSLVIAIVLAPWPIQLLMLLAVLLSPSLLEADFYS
jgi:hypothetical protein